MDTKARFTTSGCKGWIYHQLIFVEVLTFIVEMILVIRCKLSLTPSELQFLADAHLVYVLYNQNKIILWTMILVFVAEVAMMVACLAIVLPRLTFSPDCLVASVPGFFMTYWCVNRGRRFCHLGTDSCTRLSSLAFETFLFVLTLVKFFQNVSRSPGGKSSILFIFVRDGTWAFALIFGKCGALACPYQSSQAIPVAMLLNMLMYKLNTTPLVGMGYGYVVLVGLPDD